MPKKVVAIVGSYRKQGAVDTVVEQMLQVAKAQGAQTKKIHLMDQHLEFCLNCRACTQTSGPQHGTCVQKDDLNMILDEIEQADALIIGSPVNFYNITAVSRKFLERLIGFAYWPWDSKRGPQVRHKEKRKKAVLVTASGMPGFLVPITTGATRALKLMATTLGAKPVKTVIIGLSMAKSPVSLSERNLQKARKAAERLLE